MARVFISGSSAGFGLMKSKLYFFRFKH